MWHVCSVLSYKFLQLDEVEVMKISLFHFHFLQSRSPHQWMERTFSPGSAMCDHCGSRMYGLSCQGGSCQGRAFNLVVDRMLSL